MTAIVGQAPGLQRPLRPPVGSVDGAGSPAQAEGLPHLHRGGLR
jgi:hypothetical protein